MVKELNASSDLPGILKLKKDHLLFKENIGKSTYLMNQNRIWTN